MDDQNIDDAKGRVKEAAGAITGDESLKNEGKQDQAKATMKRAVDTISEKWDEAKEALSGSHK